MYIPRIKKKGFCPNPVAVNGGPPAYADSISFPEVEGTTAHTDWWMEQFDICKNGYTTGGIFIPGRYYYYLNFCYISTVGRGYHHPDYVDYDLEYAELVDEAKRSKKGIIGLKRRRAGFSEKWVNMVGNYGMRFGSSIEYGPKGYSAGIVSGLSTYSEELGKKLLNTNHLMAPELSLHIPKQGDDWEIYYVEETKNKNSKKAGTFGKVKIRTANTNSGVMKGERYDDVAFEEAGEFELLTECLGDTEACFKVGDLMVGTPYIYGTGGNISKGSKTFMELWHNAEVNHLLKTEAYLGRLRNKHYIGSTNVKGEIEFDCPNIMEIVDKHGLSMEQVLGCEDVKEAEKIVLTERADLLKKGQTIKYYKSLQTDPVNDREAFMKFNANQYPLEILALREADLLIQDFKNYRAYKPSWKMDINGAIKLPLEIELTPIPDEEQLFMGDYVFIHNDHLIPKNIKNLYYAGLDGYDIDLSQVSKSLGAMCIGTRMNNVPGVRNKQVVAIVYCRPSRKERFYELCAMMSVRFSLIGATMCDARSPGVIEWYKRNGFTKYLAKRPQSVESEFSEQIHDYGYKQTPFSKQIAIGKVQSWCVDEGPYCDFELMLKDLRDYDETAAGTDWDLHDALQDMLIGIDDKPVVAYRGDKKDEYDPFAIATTSKPMNPSSFEEIANQRSTGSSGQIYDPFQSW
jgi:hypothetical protein